MTPHRPHAGQPSLASLTDRPAAALRLLCLPPAGCGPSFYRPWAEHLPESVDLWAVRLPGRGALADHASLTDPHHTTTAIADLIHQNDDDRPFALFGHSLGSLLAYETTRTLVRARHRTPVLLALSALPAPHLDTFVTALSAVLLDGRQGAARLLGPIPDELLNEPQILAAAYTPILADLLLALQYRHQPEPLLDLPVAVYGGQDDPIAPMERLRTWGDLTTQPVSPQLFPGAHSYPDQQIRALTDRLCKDLHAAARYTVATP
ncbi:thioesterase II family protein [Streptomyces agglomeratus]|uniref:thioesterase II family protein n=1 Tax=Streptomyces agglomeratus TaxID=285458 RepID=UPI001F0B3297|nr:alpha/beta fold hydrolase [Streptomyces agglomeratus]